MVRHGDFYGPTVNLAARQSRRQNRNALADEALRPTVERPYGLRVRSAGRFDLAATRTRPRVPADARLVPGTELPGVRVTSPSSIDRTATQAAVAGGHAFVLGRDHAAMRAAKHAYGNAARRSQHGGNLGAVGARRYPRRRGCVDRHPGPFAGTSPVGRAVAVDRASRLDAATPRSRRAGGLVPALPGRWPAGFGSDGSERER
jgi:hypothetical protein